MQLTAMRVLITGGSSGIGKATAHALVQAGAQVAICGRNEAKLAAAAQEIGATPLPGDVADPATAERLVQQTISALGGYNVLINNAAYGYFSPLVDTDAAAFRAMMDTNVFGALEVARFSARHFISQQQGDILNIGSTAATKGFANGGPYVASKFALRGLTECWRTELRPHNIRVMLVNPSEVLTDFQLNAGGQAAPENPTKLHADDIAHAIVQALAMHDRGFIPELTVWATNPKP